MFIVLLYGSAFILFIHGLIHLMGFATYWQLAEIKELPYTTAVLAGRWEVGETGIRLFGVLWLVAAVGFVVGAVGLLTKQDWRLPVLLGVTVLSLVITLLNYNVAYAGVVFNIVLLVVLGLGAGVKVTPESFPPYVAETAPIETVALPQDLPAPVLRYFQATIGDTIPVIHSAVLTGTAEMRFVGVGFNGRFRFTHDAGHNYRHYIELALFGRPIMKVNESYLDGHSRLELPFGTVENEPQVDSAANLGLWGESFWLPSIFITDARVRWEAIDDTTARLIVPVIGREGEEDTFTVHFDSETGLIALMEAMRWKNAGDTEKTLWTFEAREWRTVSGVLIPAVGAVAWGDEDGPWAVFTVEEAIYNADVSAYVRARGL